jgi:hypothetical protein
MKTWFCCLLLAVSAPPILACDLCAIYAASRARDEVGAGVFAGVAEQFTHLGTLQFEGEEIANPADQYLDSSASQVFAGYNFNNRVGLQLNLMVFSARLCMSVGDARLGQPRFNTPFAAWATTITILPMISPGPAAQGTTCF